MSLESAFIASLRGFAAGPEARALLDDAAVLDVAGRSLVLTHDMLVEGVHYLPGDPPADVAWKLVAVNLSDLAAKGARPLGVLLGYSLGDGAWDAAFVAGLGAALESFDVALLGGDTVRGTGPRTFSLTAIGEAEGMVPSRAGAQAGDRLWVTGSLGDAGAGLRALLGEIAAAPPLIDRYRRPQPRLQAGRALAALATAMMDVSDGLLIDAGRIAAASGVGVAIDLAALPLSADFIAALGVGREARLFAAAAGDDYELLFAAAPGRDAEILALSAGFGLPITPVGALDSGRGLRLVDGAEAVPLPEYLGWEHR